MERQGTEYFMPNQFDNPANPQAHYDTTAPEIVRDTQGEADWFVAGMGTTGTLMGCARYFREQHPRTRVAGVEPSTNHRIQGLKNMQESIVPKLYRSELLDRKIVCSDDDAFETVRDLAVREGLFCGISSGAALWGAMALARELPRGSTVVVLFPDRGDRYLSTEVFRSVCAQCPP
jgi:cysteine synthase B